MKYYIYVAAACALLLIAACAASASTPYVSVPVPSSFVISESSKAIDDSANEQSPGPRPIVFTRSDNALWVLVPATVRNGTRLVSLEDRGSGIIFRNNTMILPVYAAGEKAGSLVAVTENLTAKRDGYYGQVTGLELHLAGISASRNGSNFTGGAVILMRDLPAGAEYRMSFADSDIVEKAVSIDLAAKARAVADISPTLSIESVTRAGNDAAGYVIVTIQVKGDWPEIYDADNITLYRYSDGQLDGLRPVLLKTENGTLYEAMGPGVGQYVLLAARPLDNTATDTTIVDAGGLAIIGGTLTVLLIALTAMIRRVTKR